MADDNQNTESMALSQMGATFAERAAARMAAQKAVHTDEVEDKSVTSSATKARKPRAKRG